jgi:16S rRNA (cytidine1402-2'-O)-methyltransferase
MHVIPGFNLEIIHRLKIFIVEEIKTARRFMRKAGYKGNFNDIEFFINNEHTQAEEKIEIFSLFGRGKDIGLLSEAGVPCVADPGAEIVREAHERGIGVRPLVGPSSILLSLMASGFNGQHFVFHGYLPVKKGAREATLRSIEKDIYRENRTQIFIEAPYRNMRLFETIISICSPSTKLCTAADLTSSTEFIRTKTIGEWKKQRPELHKRPVVFLLYR